MRRKLMASVFMLLVMPIGCLSVGCMASLKGEGQVGIYSKTEYGFFHRAIKDQSDGEALSSLDLQSAIDYIIKLRDDEQAEAPVE